MKKVNLMLILSALFITGFTQSSIYDFTVKEASGGNIDLATFKGKRILIINVASATSRAAQYNELKKYYEEYKRTGLIVLCFPTNDFNDPNNDEEIKNFFKGSNNQFILCKKLSVKGNEISPLYEWLTQKRRNGVLDIHMIGGYQKFLIGEDGKLINFFSEKAPSLALEGGSSSLIK